MGSIQYWDALEADWKQLLTSDNAMWVFKFGHPAKRHMFRNRRMTNRCASSQHDIESSSYSKGCRGVKLPRKKTCQCANSLRVGEKGLRVDGTWIKLAWFSRLPTSRRCRISYIPQTSSGFFVGILDAFSLEVLYCAVFFYIFSQYFTYFNAATANVSTVCQSFPKLSRLADLPWVVTAGLSLTSTISNPLHFEQTIRPKVHKVEDFS